MVLPSAPQCPCVLRVFGVSLTEDRPVDRPRFTTLLSDVVKTVTAGAIGGGPSNGLSSSRIRF